MPADTIDLSQSLSIFTEVFDRNGNALQSTGLINNNLPQPPKGVFDMAEKNNENMVTWQPQNNIRLAMVFEKINSPAGGFIAAGRSLKETEIRESNLLKMIGIAWLICIAVVLIHLSTQTIIYNKTVTKRL